MNTASSGSQAHPPIVSRMVLLKEEPGEVRLGAGKTSLVIEIPNLCDATAVENDTSYAKFVSAGQSSMLPPNLNIKLGRREGNRVEDAYTGRWYWDCWRQGSKFNLGHRPPKLVQAWKESIDYVDGGSWLQVSGYRA